MPSLHAQVPHAQCGSKTGVLYMAAGHIFGCGASVFDIRHGAAKEGRLETLSVFARVPVLTGWDKPERRCPRGTSEASHAARLTALRAGAAAGPEVIEQLRAVA